MLPSLYQAIASESRKHRFVFVGFYGEEEGMIGSEHYVHELGKEKLAHIDAMVNMDTLGLAPSEVWASHSDKRLSGVLASIAKQLNLPLSGVDVDKIGSSDAESFAERKIPRITIHSLTQETWNAGILHTSKDKFSALRLDDYYQTYRLLAAYIAFLDQLATFPPAPTKH